MLGKPLRVSVFLLTERSGSTYSPACGSFAGPYSPFINQLATSFNTTAEDTFSCDNSGCGWGQAVAEPIFLFPRRERADWAVLSSGGAEAARIK